MAHIYIADRTREMLDSLVIAEKRSISAEIEYLCENRLKELGILEMKTPSVGKYDSTKPEKGSQA